MQLSEGSLVTIALFIIVQTGGFIWAFATFSEKLRSLGDSVNNLSSKLIAMDSIFAKREDVAKDIGFQEKRIDAIFNKLDKIS